ncbi:MAG: hypothetical protein NDP23_05710 [Crenarchaeota archaeon]|nr:hypothetical protein [Thermoproteota archaeon]MCR8489025.1 hypothetical protein [Thermoproteota archaeon]
MSALKEASKATLAVFLAIIIGLLIQKAMTDSSHFHNMLLDPKQIIDYIVSSLLSPVGSISPFVILLAVFALMVSSFSSLQKLGVAPTVSMEKAPKKKVREEKAEAAPKVPEVSEPAPTGPTEPCPICGKPKPMGRAICKECEEKLKAGPEAFSKPSEG